MQIFSLVLICSLFKIGFLKLRSFFNGNFESRVFKEDIECSQSDSKSPCKAKSVNVVILLMGYI